MSKVVIQALRDFNRGEVFFDHLADDVVLEFPYGPTADIPERIVGKDAVSQHLRKVQEAGLTISEPAVSELTHGGVVAEYIGRYQGGDGGFDVPLISLIQHRNRRLTLIREYWDTKMIADNM